MTSTDADTETGTQTTAHQGTGSGARSSPFRHAETDRDAAPQFVLPLVVRIEKAAPPARTDALETAARAVLVLLSDERATAADGEWAEAVRDWQDARIRKVVRRARGAEWRRASGLPGITVTGRAPAPATATAEDVTGHEGGDGDVASSAAAAEVRVFPPVPLDGWPKELAKLQVSGTDLDDPEPPAAPDPTGPVLWLSPHVEMSAGKAMAQAGHGAQLAWWELDDAARAAWREAGFPLAVRTASAERWDELTASGLPVVRDAGFTEIAPGSCTVVADHPALRRR
ncbi:peptidyl-tRNA hydrolase [Streptomyces sp. DSM 41524]|uniref:peptidyl-tRNA hydrolase n=1 Tax=Streptomyces asiaticus subsp. ignotus TaxID=3098222 RepID=A0ABU7Q2T8_9ACTN|nr:peptidyl-tRNA hydrolase [Streptomyces sp. DSM 41524]